MKQIVVITFTIENQSLEQGMKRLRELLSDGGIITSYCATGGTFVYTIERKLK
jgi:hypothetical protein